MPVDLDPFFADLAGSMVRWRRAKVLLAWASGKAPAIAHLMQADEGPVRQGSATVSTVHLPEHPHTRGRVRLAMDRGFYGQGMTSTPIVAAWRPYLRVLAGTGLDVVCVGAWVAAAGLSPARRRLARGALSAVVVAVAIPGARTGLAAIAGTSEPAAPGARSGLPFVDAGIRLPASEPSDVQTSPGRQAVRAGAIGAAVLTAAVTASIGAAAAGRQLERRWLERLVRRGHQHPHRDLGVRMAALYAVLVVPSRLLAVRQTGAHAAREGRPVE